MTVHEAWTPQDRKHASDALMKRFGWSRVKADAYVRNFIDRLAAAKAK